MKMDFQYDYSSLEHITFEGLNGCETVRDLKNALELLKVENPKRPSHANEMCSKQNATLIRHKTGRRGIVRNN